MGVGQCGRRLYRGSPQSPPTGGWLSWRVLARPRPVCKNIWGEIGDCQVTATARIVPYPFLGISVSDFRKFKCTTHKNFRDCVVSHTFLECVGNATRGMTGRRTFFFKFKSVYQGVTSARGVRNIKIERHPVRSC